MSTKKQIYVLHEKLAEIAKSVPDKIAMQIKIAGKYSCYSFAAIDKRARRVASALIASGVRPGDRVAILLENGPNWGTLYFGIMYAGATAVPIDTQAVKEDIAYFVADSGSKIIFAGKQFLPMVENLGVKVIADDDELAAATSTLPEVSPDTIASILYTSGTTGKPKGVMLSHRNFCADFYSIDKLRIVTARHNMLSILPLHHSFPFMVTLLLPLFVKGKITYPENLSSEALLQCCRETKVSIFPGVPQIFYLFHRKIVDTVAKQPLIVRSLFWTLAELGSGLRKITRINFSRIFLPKVHRQFGGHLKFFASGGAKLDAKIAGDLIKFGFTILEGYGLTETAPVVTFNPLGKAKVGSAGKVIPDVEVKIVDADASGVGEIAIRGQNVMRGYYNKPQETDIALHDGWFYSGDLGYLDRDSYLFIEGRKKEIIILSSGKNISPEDVESHYAKTKFIKEICVLAAGEISDEKLVAVIVPDFEYYRQIGESNIYERLRWELENLSKNYPAYKRIKGFVITKENLPRTRLGKLRRHAVQYLFASGSCETRQGDGDSGLIISDVGKKVIAVINEKMRLQKPAKISDHLELDLGLDSLSRVELVAILEKSFDVRLSEEDAAHFFTVRELVLAIGKALHEDMGALEKPTAEFSWHDILQNPLAPELLKKIDLTPGFFDRTFLRAARFLPYQIFRSLWHLKIIGRENIPKAGNFVLCANHASFLDGVIIAAALPASLRIQVFFLGYQPLFESLWFRKIIKLVRVIPIDSAKHLVEAMQLSAYVLRNKKSMAIFPEGERSIDGEIKPFKKGVGVLAKELDVDLIPVYIDGAFAAWPRMQKFPKLYPLKVIIGKPCRPYSLRDQGYGLGAQDDYEAIAKGIREEIIKLHV